VKEVAVSTWCDRCGKKGTRTPGDTTPPVAIGSGAPQTLDLCEPCKEQLLGEIAALLEEFGVGLGDDDEKGRQDVAALAKHQKRRGRAPVGDTQDCLWCELTYSIKAGGFARHLRVAHGFDGTKEAFGGPCPICGEGPYELMLSHTQKTHPEFGFTGVAQPFMWARDNGDPYGVHAAKLEQKGSLDPNEEWNRVREIERAEARENTRSKASA
jgi:hypothetical protein